MNVRKLAVLVCTVLLVATAAVAAGLKAGQYRVTIETEMPGMPMKVPAITADYCLTQEQADNPQPPKGKNDDCVISDYKLDGNTVTWKVACEKQKLTGEGQMTLNGDSYEGSTHNNMGEMEIIQKMTGKRIGDCPEKK